MRRLFFLTPDSGSCHAIVDELKEMGVPQRHLHVVASIEQTLEDLPEAGILQQGWCSAAAPCWQELRLGLVSAQ